MVFFVPTGGPGRKSPGGWWFFALRQLCVLYWLGNGISVGLFRVPELPGVVGKRPKKHGKRPLENPPKKGVANECLEGEMVGHPYFSWEKSRFW